jgi:hypothetical protein
MTTEELKAIAVRMVSKGYTDRDKIRYSDDLYKATPEEIDECLDYVDEIIQNGLKNFK